MRRALRLTLAGSLCASTLIVGAVGAPADATPPTYTRTVEPWDPLSPPNPGAVPAVNLTAACVRLTRTGQVEAVFGYDNPGEHSVFTQIEDQPSLVDANVIVRDRFRLTRPFRQTFIDKFGPQATLFKPGNHPYAFAVRYNLNELVAWRVYVPPNDDGPGFKVTVRPRLAACPADVPHRFAVVQSAYVEEGPTNIVKDGDAIISYDMAASVTNVRVACSAGGVPQSDVDVLIGWSVPADNHEPLTDVKDFVPLDQGGGIFTGFQLSPTTSRPVLDVSQEVRWLGPIADVTGYCDFGAQSVASDIFWAGVPGFGTVTPFVQNGVVTELQPGIVLPGASRIR